MSDTHPSGQRLRRIRENTQGEGDKHLPRDVFAYLAGMSTTTMKSWEDSGVMRAAELEDIVRLTGVSLNWLVLGIGDPYLPASECTPEVDRLSPALPASDEEKEAAKASARARAKDAKATRRRGGR